VQVKICGLTNYDDAMYAVQAGADALGFVFYEKSPRYISFEDTAKIIEKLPPFIIKVGLFVKHSKDEIEKGADISGIDLAQIHFDIEQEFLDNINFKTLPVIRAKSAKDIDKFSGYRLIDAYSEAYGGSGKRLNLEWFSGVDCSQIIVAGGLSPDNLEQLKGYGFYGVDVSSGVELHKGKKDYSKVKEFIKNAKSLWTINSSF